MLPTNAQHQSLTSLPNKEQRIVVPLLISVSFCIPSRPPYGCKGRLTGLPLVDFALQASVTRNSIPSPESRFTPQQPTTKRRTPGQGERTASQKREGRQ
jgi:hypothetical protein